jgi:hypothetical protein
MLLVISSLTIVFSFELGIFNLLFLKCINNKLSGDSRLSILRSPSSAVACYGRALLRQAQGYGEPRNPEAGSGRDESRPYGFCYAHCALLFASNFGFNSYELSAMSHELIGSAPCSLLYAPCT